MATILQAVLQKPQRWTLLVTSKQGLGVSRRTEVQRPVAVHPGQQAAWSAVAPSVKVQGLTHATDVARDSKQIKAEFECMVRNTPLSRVNRLFPTCCSGVRLCSDYVSFIEEEHCVSLCCIAAQQAQQFLCLHARHVNCQAVQVLCRQIPDTARPAMAGTLPVEATAHLTGSQELEEMLHKVEGDHQLHLSHARTWHHMFGSDTGLSLRPHLLNATGIAI